MKGKKESTKKKGQHAVKAAHKPDQGELSEKDMQKVVGGSPRDPHSGLPTGQ